ncbi:MAG: glycyl-radical enzyme activating protein [Treponema sp.]|nr:glycyl-radical enzyme activating protein [Treponema sp.]
MRRQTAGGLVTNIQRFSTDDGPGIRTTVFFKGCTLSCRWCHNPETISPKKQLQFQEEACGACGACARICPAGAHSLAGGRHELNRRNCTGCFACVEACLYGALEAQGRDMTPGDLAEQLLRDKPFYDNSGGGVTFSGGEPLLQAGFCADTMRLLKEKGIHTAVDTAGNVGWEQFQKTLPWTDLFLFDIKLAEEQKHREWTGAGNSLILENFARLCDTGKDIWIRTPIITGVNDDDDESLKRAALIKDRKTVKKVELLPYHAYGMGKYAALGMGDRWYDFGKVSGEAMLRIKTLMEGRGVPEVLFP